VQQITREIQRNVVEFQQISQKAFLSAGSLFSMSRRGDRFTYIPDAEKKEDPKPTPKSGPKPSPPPAEPASEQQTTKLQISVPRGRFLKLPKSFEAVNPDYNSFGSFGTFQPPA
jgi:hypothetical protein